MGLVRGPRASSGGVKDIKFPSLFYLFTIFFSVYRGAIRVALVYSILRGARFFGFAFYGHLYSNDNRFTFIVWGVFFIRLRRHVRAVGPVLRVRSVSPPYLSFNVIRVRYRSLVRVCRFFFIRMIFNS